MCAIANPTTKANILLVDDSVENLRVLSTMLMKQGYEVRCARSGAIALTSLQTIATDLILLDIRMPTLDGYKVCQTLKSRSETREIPVIFISALDEAMDKVKAFEVGGADYITKPFEIPEVLARIQHQLTISQLQAQLQQRNDELARSNRELEQFTATVSHDLKTPLQSFLYYVEVLEEQYPRPIPESARRYFTRLNAVSQTMQTLIDDLLLYTQVGQLEQVLVPVNCDQVLAKVLDNLAPQLSATGAQLTHDPLPTVLGDPTQLLQLFQNLLSNALKFCQPETVPQVQITVQPPSSVPSVHSDKQTEARVTIGVHDRGIGLDLNAGQQIFDVFTRLSAAKRYPGNGIGLATCQKIVNLHGGKIWVESELDQGSSFYVELPLAPEI